MANNTWLLLFIPFGFLLLYLLEQEEKPKESGGAFSDMLEQEEQAKPSSGRTFSGQSNESYCLECIENHTMAASTEMRHAVDRYRTAKEMTPGVTEKVRVAIGELQGIVEDAKNIEGAAPEVEQGINEILDEVRWVRKEYGLAGKGLTTGHGSEQDLAELRTRIGNMQLKAYDLVAKCPTCQISD